MGRVRRSPRAALNWGLQVGLPATAILVAVNPIWGFSWFFNSESWTTGIWDRWAEARADTWREKMIEAVCEQYQGTNVPADRLFAVEPEGVTGTADFSFLVLGDTGEGGAAQHSLRDQYLFLGQRPDVKFLVISSDVIYPAGAMQDYEPNFYLPFKGFTKPIYAIPGNHDWYDALEAFAANFLEPYAARASMRARMEADGRWTTTTPKQIEAKIEEAGRLRREYGTSIGSQRGPFFELQTERFALIAVDTGVVRGVDTEQWAWLKAALDRARGKFVMAILGHPLYAGGRYQGGHDEPFAGEWAGQGDAFEFAGNRLGSDSAPFAAIHRLLREHHVEVVMAGDTHYFEHYRETYEAAGVTRTMYHFVNGGGGAYMSIGTPFDWPARPAVPDCAFYPRRDFLIEKLDRETPAWKKPLWWWEKHLSAWPLTAESMAAAFRYDRAPYLQSFVEVRVENSKAQVRLIPHGANGPLRWRDMETFGTVRPNGKTEEDPAEFIVPISRPQP
ncbi:MAG TPA: metallophosphoesterase, partial [Gemmataceae bacterium]|nr:metallophosphoesterase [Gemmataceae bacterium]